MQKDQYLMSICVDFHSKKNKINNHKANTNKGDSLALIYSF